MAPNFRDKINQMPFLYQSILVGLLTGGFTGFIIKFFFERFGASGVVLTAFLVFGALLGFFGGKEKERVERLKAEKALLEGDVDKIQRMLHQAEGKYRLLIENISDAIYLTTEKGKFLLFNEATSLLSGYSRDELKGMTLSQIQNEDEMTEKHQRAWLDNGICRYEEQWRNKTGESLQLDVNARWIKVAGMQCILHVARNMAHRMEAIEETRTGDLVRFARDRSGEVARAVRVVQQKFISPMNNTMDAVNREIKKLPAVDAKFSPFFMDWEKKRKVLQLVEDKNNRNLDESVAQWNLNEVLRQELFYLCMMTGSDAPFRKASFSPGIPLLTASGKDLSLILETLLHAAYQSIRKAGKSDMSVSSLMENGQAVVQIMAPDSSDFEFHLSRKVDPAVIKDNEMEIKRGMNFMELLLDPLKYKLEVEHPETGGVNVRLRMPIEGQNRTA